MLTHDQSIVSSHIKEWLKENLSIEVKEGLRAGFSSEFTKTVILLKMEGEVISEDYFTTKVDEG